MLKQMDYKSFQEMLKKVFLALFIVAAIACNASPRVALLDKSGDLKPNTQQEVILKEVINLFENVSYKKIFTSIARCFGKKPPFKKVSPFLAEIVWRLETLKSLVTGKKHLLTKETARTAQAKVYFDNSKILKALPEFHFTPIEASIRHTCEKMKEEYKLGS